jgi:hypothetical protein
MAELLDNKFSKIQKTPTQATGTTLTQPAISKHQQARHIASLTRKSSDTIPKILRYRLRFDYHAVTKR